MLDFESHCPSPVYSFTLLLLSPQTFPRKGFAHRLPDIPTMSRGNGPSSVTEPGGEVMGEIHSCDELVVNSQLECEILEQREAISVRSHSGQNPS